MQEQKITTEVGIVATSITTETSTTTPTDMIRDQTLWLPPTTEPTITISSPFSPLVHIQQLIVRSCILKKAKDLIIGQL